MVVVVVVDAGVVDVVLVVEVDVGGEVVVVVMLVDVDVELAVVDVGVAEVVVVVDVVWVVEVDVGGEVVVLVDVDAVELEVAEEVEVDDGPVLVVEVVDVLGIEVLVPSVVVDVVFVVEEIAVVVVTTVVVVTAAQWHSTHAPRHAASEISSHASPRSGSTKPSPHRLRSAVTGVEMLDLRAVNVPVSSRHSPLTVALSVALPLTPSQKDQRTRIFVPFLLARTRPRVSLQPLSIAMRRPTIRIESGMGASGAGRIASPCTR
jgi:hypothetical protein